jgi:adenine-specific DNA-methyltransferase
MARAAKHTTKDIESLKHREARRKHIPTTELESLVSDEERAPKPIRYRRNTDRDPQLAWRGKDEQDAEDLMVDSVPIYIQEKIQPEAIIRDLRRRSEAIRREREERERFSIPDLFSDFNGLSEPGAEFTFYQHDKNWSNRMILGDSLLVMTSLAEKEALKGQIQCIYMDPPYGIAFNSNWQHSTREKTGDQANKSNVTRESEVIKAFADTWADGIHSYLSYLRDRLKACHGLLTPSGSVFVQIGEDNAHLVKSLLDEIFGDKNCVVTIVVKKKGGQKSSLIDPVNDYILWYSRSHREGGTVKFNPLYEKRELDEETVSEFSRVEEVDGSEVGLVELERLRGKRRYYRDSPERILEDLPSSKLFRPWPITNGGSRANQNDAMQFQGRCIPPPLGRCWSHTVVTKDGSIPGMYRVLRSGRLLASANALDFKRYLEDFPYKTVSNWWDQLGGAPDPIYVVQTNEEIIKRCILMTTDPGDLILDPTCGSGTTAHVAEKWGRRWITIDTSRVALALARQRLMAARYPSCLLQDSAEGARKEGQITGRPARNGPFGHSIRQGFVYQRASHITSGAIARNSEIDVIWDKWQPVLGPLLGRLNEALDWASEEWEVPRKPEDDWLVKARELHAQWWEAKRERQKEIDASIARNADIEYLVDRPYEDRGKVRVAGPFTVESLSPHRVLSAEEEDALWAEQIEAEDGRPLPPRTRSARREEARRAEDDFVRVVLDNLLKAGVQNTKKGERLHFTELKPWPGGRLINLEGGYEEAGRTRRVAVAIGPEYGTVSYGLVREAAREALDSVFDTLIICGFAFEPKVNEEALTRFPRLTVLKARMGNDLHLADSLRSQTNNANLFVIFGEPDITIHNDEDGRVRVEILGLDIFDPTTGEVRSSSLDDIAAWFIDTDYDGESFFVRHAYFLGGNDPYKRLKTTLKAEIDEEAWATLYSAVSRPFEKPESGAHRRQSHQPLRRRGPQGVHGRLTACPILR